MFQKQIHTFLLLMLLLNLWMPTPRVQSAVSAQTPITSLQQQSSGPVTVAYQTGTSIVRFIGTAPVQPVRQSLSRVGYTPELAAHRFLAGYGSLFGLRDQALDLSLVRTRMNDNGLTSVRFQQQWQGVPVLGGELIVQVTAAGDVVAAIGETLPEEALNITPKISATQAQTNALAAMAKQHGLSTTQLQASPATLWVYNPKLIRPDTSPSRLVWRTEVTPTTLRPIRELVLIDAQTGGLALNFNQIDTAMNRLTYTANNGTTLPGTLVCNQSNDTCSNGDTHAQAAHKYARDTYNFYSTNHSRDSIDNAGLTLISTVRYGSNYANAFWSGEQMVYGDAYGFPLADDVVAHELTHGVTEYESGLFYYYQSGAINEAFSDIWGEFVDQSNGAGTDTAGVKWQMGEDVSGLGALRNMQNPTAFGDPDKMTSPNYHLVDDETSITFDNGGVHSNSGIANKTAYLLADGSTFNGYTVSALGLTKTAKIFYEAQTNLLTSGADYGDLYNALIQACNNLVGTAGITSGNCQEVQDAVNATEMNLQPVAGWNTEASLCNPGFIPINVFYDTLESGTGNWVTTSSDVARWFTDDTYYHHSGTIALLGNDYPPQVSDSSIAMVNNVTLPANAFLHFYHAYGFENPNWDGGVLEYSTNNGSSWNDAGALFQVNGYDGAIATGEGNPLAGRSAFLNDSHGYISSRLTLASLAGQNVRFRWRMGLDSIGYDYGWWIDDMRIYTCFDTSTLPNKVYLPLVRR